MLHLYDHDLERTLAAMTGLRRRMDRMFDELDGFGRGTERARATFPKGAFADKGDRLELVLDLPGLADKDVQLSVREDVLTVTAERKAEAPEGYYVHRHERPTFKLAKNYGLPCKVDAERSTATLKNGVMTVVLQKAADAQPRQISVKAS